MTGPAPVPTSLAPADLVVTNESTILTDAEVQAVIAPLQAQVETFAQVWGRAATLSFVARTEMASVPTDAWLMVVLDNADQAGALGYHTVSPNGTPMGKVFAHTCAMYSTSWTVDISHETLEILLDPGCVYTITYSLPTGIVITAMEVADPVQADNMGYVIDGVLLSDWVLPGYWSGPGVGAAPFDYKGHLAVPFNPSSPISSVGEGGYVSVWTQPRGWQQVMAPPAVIAPTAADVVVGAPSSAASAAPPLGSRRQRRMFPDLLPLASDSWEAIASRRQHWSAPPLPSA